MIRGEGVRVVGKTVTPYLASLDKTRRQSEKGGTSPRSLSDKSKRPHVLKESWSQVEINLLSHEAPQQGSRGEREKVESFLSTLLQGRGGVSKGKGRLGCTT